MGYNGFFSCVEIVNVNGLCYECSYLNRWVQGNVCDGLDIVFFTV